MESDIGILAGAPPPIGESTPFADFVSLAEVPDAQNEVLQIEAPQTAAEAIDAPPSAIAHAPLSAANEDQPPPIGDDHFRATLVAAEISGVLALIANEFFASRDAHRKQDGQPEGQSEPRSESLSSSEPSSDRRFAVRESEVLFSSTDHEPPRSTATIIPFPTRKR